MKLISSLLSCVVMLTSTAWAATLPSGFSETQVATGLSSPTAQSVHLRLRRRERRAVHQRCRRSHLGRDRRRDRRSNYGWPTTEGATTDPRFRSPRFTYNHTDGVCAITGGAFYSPLTAEFPSDYSRDYFFADYCGGWIHKLDVSSGAVTTFATGIASPVVRPGVEVVGRPAHRLWA
jgi:hypothetical protein